MYTKWEYNNGFKINNDDNNSFFRNPELKQDDIVK